MKEALMALADAVPAGAARLPRPAFLSPAVDFLCLGGGSLLLLPVLMWVVPDHFNVQALTFATLLANVINNPHFANSYQIFYRTFGVIVSDPASDRMLRTRYLWAGVGAPVLIVLSFAAALAWGDARTIGLAGNAMGFFVGWHYVKQGYGMLMVDAAQRRGYFGESDKKVLLVNSYACWIVSWLAVNATAHERNLWGLRFAMLDVPPALLWLGGGALAVTSAYTAWILVRHARAHRGTVPVTGIMAYIAALYPWIFLFSQPVLGVLIPAMHSLQYLVIVWRYQINVEQAKPDAAVRSGWIGSMRFAPTKAVTRFVVFIVWAIALGVFGFWAFPTLLDTVVPYDHAMYGNYLFMFLLTIFINVHHYFIDNAMWRKENPHTLRHLFSHR
jgi:hypothetical protein